MNFSFGNTNKAARVGDQIDAQVKAAKALLEQALQTTKNFDTVEMQLQQIGNMMQQSQDPLMQMVAMQFDLLKQTIDSAQKQIQTSLNQMAPVLSEIDTQTNAIQN